MRSHLVEVIVTERMRMIGAIVTGADVVVVAVRSFVLVVDDFGDGDVTIDCRA